MKSLLEEVMFEGRDEKVSSRGAGGGQLEQTPECRWGPGQHGTCETQVRAKAMTDEIRSRRV